MTCCVRREPCFNAHLLSAARYINNTIEENKLEIKSSDGRENDCNWIRTHNHLVHKRTLNHLAKLAKRLSCVVSTYLYGAFDCMFLSCHVRVSE